MTTGPHDALSAIKDIARLILEMPAPASSGCNYAPSQGDAGMKQIDHLPDILTPVHIAEYLHISRGRVYELCQLSPEAGGIRSFKIGGSRRVDKQDLISWINDRKGER